MQEAAHKAALEALGRKRRGEELSAKDEGAVAAYYAQYKDRRQSVYFESPAQRADFQARADEAGYKNFNQWIVDQLKLAASGKLVDAEALSMMRQRLAELGQREEQAQARAEEYRKERNEVQAALGQETARNARLEDELVGILRDLAAKGLVKGVKPRV